LELETKADAELLVSNGFDVDEFNFDCSPPHGKFLNVSILGLRSYVDDDEVKLALTEYGVLKSDVIRLKYKADHDLAGMENGNRLVKMVLDKPSLLYSMRIGGDWCRSIHNNQHPFCLECKEPGHTRKKCQMIRCRVCKQLGHMSYNCDQREENDQAEPSAERDGAAAVIQQDAQRGVPSECEEDLEKDTRTNNNQVNEITETSRHRSQVLLGGVSTWLSDHLGIRRFVDFWTNFDSLKKISMGLHTIIIPSAIQNVFIFFTN